MLEVKNLVKCYSTKGGVTVKALDNVSVKFPETGMVFLLGRSGSGKSTLLNVSGGLDKPDSGEVIVKGKSSKDFTTADFDSYRNTFIGFVFQEYNILNEFTVEQNIALALQLQNKPNDKKAVNELLEKVDLKGLGRRKPNTLSGGQKQRVAIARALIKEPEIIMADEPTGALDSNTGKQVFDTLKKLSETKLVIVVSHDREFAEQYGDRIIELKDGQILSDVEKAYSEPKNISENVQVVSEDTISIKNAEEITEADVKNIVAMLKKNKGEAIITAGKKELPDVKRACKINDNGNKEYFKQTGEVAIKEYDGSKTKFIKSRLPASHAFKMGASGLKTKPIRLIFTVLLSVVAFLMFGVVSTFMLYDANYSVSEAMKTANYPTITVSKYYKYIDQSIKVDKNTGVEQLENEWERESNTLFGVQELKDKNALGGDFAGIFNFTNSRWDSNQSYPVMIVNGSNSIAPNIDSKDELYYPVTEIYGFTDCGGDYMARNGYTLIGEGRYPETKTEIAIPEYVAEWFTKTNSSGITNVSDMLGKKIKIGNCNAINSGDLFTVVGVYKIGEIPSEYDVLKDSTNNSISASEKENLGKSLQDYLSYNFNSILFVTEEFYDEYKDNIRNDSGKYINSEQMQGVRIEWYEFDEDVNENWSSVFTEKTVSDYEEDFEFYDLDGEKISFTLNKNQAYIPYSRYMDSYRNGVQEYASKLSSLFFYEPAQKETLIGDDSDFKNTYDNMWALTDYRAITDLVDEWYAVLVEKEYVYVAANFMRNQSSMNGDGLYTTGAFYDALSAVEYGMNNSMAIDDADWNVLKTYVNDQTNGFKQYCPQNHYYYFYVKNVKNNMWNEGSIYVEQMDARMSELLGYEAYYDSIASQLEWMNISDDEFNAVKQVTEEFYVNVVGSAMSETLDTSVNYVNIPEKYYFKNYLGQKGQLEILGYFTTDTDSYVDYLVHSEFVAEYSEQRKGMGDEILWKNVEKTDYVAPTDAKYNFLITKTDNSQESIAVALDTLGTAGVKLKVNNSVYQELEMFLDMITEMQQIFLIVGGILGVFAALMLLNFISVSISAKKKDIGILRAVGARGSDVFKIFFAEAFIIALICFVLATVGAYVVCGIINTSMVTVVKMKLLNFQIINVGLILVVSFGISILATFFPVYFAAKKSPVESIRAL